MQRSASLAVLAALATLAMAGCAGRRAAVTPDDEPTLKSLASRKVEVAKDGGIPSSPEKAIQAYQAFLAAAPRADQRLEAMRRLGDLEMDRADAQAAGNAGSGVPDYRAAVAHYEAVLKSTPDAPGNDRVLYQLARAQEQGGQLEAALATLDRLVKEHPGTRTLQEAQFRRGELLFTLRDYPKAEAAYAAVLHAPPNPYQERALYMQGWSVFKQGRLEEALKSFFGVLDLKLTSPDAEQTMGRADRELVDDTFRVTSLSLQNLQGAESIAPYIDSELRKGYEYRVVQQLGELYLKQERVKDAADTFGAFARRQPLHEQAPVLQARVIEIYQDTGFPVQALAAKKDYVQHYGVDSEFRRANPQGWEKAQPLVRTHLAELAAHYHALAQKGKAAADVDEAVRWYRATIASFPQEADTAQANFLLAELLYENGRFAEATTEYEKTAYGYPPHAKAADAGYAALLGHAEQDKRAPAAQRPALQREAVDSARRFARSFPTDPRTGPVLTRAAEQLYALNDPEPASQLAQQVLQLQPPAAPAQRRVAWTVVAHAAFDRGDFPAAEQGYSQVLALLPEKDAARNGLVERLAASVYKQGEQARAAGQGREAVAHFARVATVAPQSPVRINAEYDAAAELIALKDWPAAAKALEGFRQRYPQHPLQAEVGPRLAAVYGEQQQWAPAAAEFERIAAASKEATLAQASQWQAAQLYEKAKAWPQAARAYERYLQLQPSFEPGVEARYRLAQVAKQEGSASRELGWMKQVFQADQAGGAARTPRTRTLGAMGALAVAQPAFETYRQVALVEPLARQLKLKKARMEEVLKAYGVAADYGVAEVTTAATFHTAALYQDFGKAMLGSQRPKGLRKAELEQYNVMLEEQAFPFEEKAVELHELNARRASQGVYDEWVQASFKALAQLKPARYGRNERSEGAIDAIR